jgi:hypothetical protein
MANLLSGLIGAVIGAVFSALLTITYVHYAERKKLQIEFTIEIIDYIDEIYHYIMTMSYQFPDEPSTPTMLTEDEHRTMVRNLTKLLTSTKPQTRLDMISSNKAIIKDFEKLREAFKEAIGACLDREAFMLVLNKKVDPLYQRIHAELVAKTRM